MSRNDPERLEAEAKELMEQMTKAKEGTPETVQSQEDTPEEPEELQQEAPDLEDKAETVAEEETVSEDKESGESEDMSLALKKAEKAMKGAQSRMTKATQEAADLKRQNADLLKSLAELKVQVVEQQRDDGKLAQLREDYPDLASPLLDELKRTQDEVKAQKEALDKQEQNKIDERNDKAAEAHFGRIHAEHPDVDSIVESADWLNWLEDQDTQTKDWIQTGSSNDVNTVLYKFKDDMGYKPPTPRERVLEKAKSVAEPKMPKSRKPTTKGGAKNYTVDEIMRMPNHVFEEHQQEILKAMEGGKIRR
jgi:chromosome segregation ATPase